MDQFLISDNEIRAKLQDRNRSPLKMADLYQGNPASSMISKIPSVMPSERDLNLLSLKKCETASKRSLNFDRSQQDEWKFQERGKWSPLRTMNREPSPVAN